MSVLADPPPAVVSEPKGLRYATGRKLGNGGFAICYAAEVVQDEKPTGKIVALKIVKNQKDRRIIQKFASELQLHSKLHHANVVEFYRAFSFDENTYVVLELCHNGSLADALKQRKFFTMPEIRRFLIQLCGAVKYLHHRNIVHRDLKTGNILLDKGMNIKIADFGLAAVLVSSKDVGIRRTTMCGTPNYLAPEILEKQGHNDKADLWSIGIIVYTLAVGKAPFHSSSKEEIYKKALAMKYEWPDVATHKNDISSDLRELVSALLVHEEEQRPNPDQIVSHPFFKLQFIPETLDSSCTKQKPSWPAVKPPSAQTLQRGYSESWFKLCQASGVGEYAPGNIFPLNGQKRVASIVRDCEKEVAAGRAPVVPMPRNSVYLPFPDRPNLLDPAVAENERAEDSNPPSQESKLKVISANDRMRKTATIRAVEQPGIRHKENVEPSRLAETAPILERQTSKRCRREEPQPKAAASAAGTSEKRSLPRPRTVSRQTPQTQNLQNVCSARQDSQQTTLARRPSRRDGTTARGTAAPAALSRDSVKEPEIATAGQRPLQVPARRPGTARKASHQEERQYAKEPAPHVIEIPDDATTSSGEADDGPTCTDPAAVLARAAQLRDNIAAALAGKRTRPHKQYTSSELPFVWKWVDYARKHGVGYVLEDGTIGCLFNSTSKHPVTHAVVRDGHRHLQHVGKDLGRVGEIPIEHWIQNQRNELVWGGVMEDRKRTTAILWTKFGKYMCQQLGETQVHGQNILDAQGKSVFPRFYQRLGAVGVWYFSNGSLQFNFPDHTKLVVSPDGTFVNFTCLSPEAMAHLKQHGDLPFKYIRSRELVSGLVTDLLFGGGGGSTRRQRDGMRTVLTTEANLLADKLRLVIRVVDEWVRAGGLGRSPGAEVQRVVWDGPQLDEGKKEEWTTVGRFGGDAQL